MTKINPIEANTLRKSEEKGRAVGREEGLAEGIEKGMEQAARIIAHRLLAEQYPIADIAKLTGLSTQTILALEKPEAVF